MKDKREWEEDLLLYCQCNAMPVGSMPRVARHANANAKAPDCGSKSGDAGRSLRAADGVQRCFVRPGEGETNSFRPFCSFFWRPGFAVLQTDKGNTGQYASWGRGEEAREREACWLVG